MRFEELRVWKLGRELTMSIYRLTKERPFRTDYDLVRQLRRAALSITSNIAEGHERDGTRENIHFLSIAKGSVGEVRSLLTIARDLEYISDDQFEILATKCKSISAALMSLMRSLKNTGHKGLKYKAESNTST